MVIWVTVFLIIIIISFVLAYRSMKDFRILPQKQDIDYGLFLVRRREAFDENFIMAIKEALGDGLIVSIERLFKGRKTTLTIFGPKMILDRFLKTLNLLELEDYAEGIFWEDVEIWEVGIKMGKDKNVLNIGNIFSNLPNLKDDEQFFWQVVLDGKRAQIRAVLLVQDPIRRKDLASAFQNLGKDALIKIPSPYSTEQMLTFYRQRGLERGRSLSLSPAALVRLLKIK